MGPHHSAKPEVGKRGKVNLSILFLVPVIPSNKTLCTLLLLAFGKKKF